MTQRTLDDLALTRREDREVSIAHKEAIEEQFVKFHRAHPEVYAALLREARIVRRAGAAHWSIDGAYEVVRYWGMVRPDPDQHYRLNNNYRAHYARLIMQEESDLDGFFETRGLRAE